ncbi:MAG: SDR family NAD(P)-dependent oxidoreductase, partial [Acetobacteraceae bacterium]
MDLGIKGRRAIICAGSKGLGRATAFSLAREGVDLVLFARTQSTLDATADEIRRETGVRVDTVAGDVATEEGRAAVLRECPDPD